MFPGTCTRLFCWRDDMDWAAMVGHRLHLAGSTGCGWLMTAVELAGLVIGDWRPSPNPVLTEWV